VDVDVDVDVDGYFEVYLGGRSSYEGKFKNSPVILSVALTFTIAPGVELVKVLSGTMIISS
jgi:hypothetical protein